MTPTRCTGTSASGTGASPPQKRGRRSRQDQEGQGNQVDASGRWPGYSAGSTPGLGQSERGQAPREDDRRGPGKAGASTGAAAVEAGPVGAGSRLRQQRAAGTTGEARDCRFSEPWDPGVTEPFPPGSLTA